ncbi:MAG: phenylpyruvate tautomerase MIF-related protein [Cyanobacteria bacterium P01_H01_bin.105]
MPLIKVQTSVDAPSKGAVEDMLKQLSASLAKHIGKPESYVMTAFQPGTAMTFGGSTDPTCYIEIKSVGTMGGKTKTMSQEFCAQVQAALGVPPDRTYIEFADAEGAMWGWNGRTFG